MNIRKAPHRTKAFDKKLTKSFISSRSHPLTVSAHTVHLIVTSAMLLARPAAPSLWAQALRVHFSFVVTFAAWFALCRRHQFCWPAANASYHILYSLYTIFLSLLSDSCCLFCFVFFRLLGLLLGCDWLMLRIANIWQHTLCSRFIAFCKSQYIRTHIYAPMYVCLYIYTYEWMYLWIGSYANNSWKELQLWP